MFITNACTILVFSLLLQRVANENNSTMSTTLDSDNTGTLIAVLIPGLLVIAVLLAIIVALIIILIVIVSKRYTSSKVSPAQDSTQFV
jgi:hypothetical protein